MCGTEVPMAVARDVVVVVIVVVVVVVVVVKVVKTVEQKINNKQSTSKQ